MYFFSYNFLSEQFLFLLQILYFLFFLLIFSKFTTSHSLTVNFRYAVLRKTLSVRENDIITLVEVFIIHDKINFVNSCYKLKIGKPIRKF